jgi:hypothetical protein
LNQTRALRITAQMRSRTATLIEREKGRGDIEHSFLFVGNAAYVHVSPRARTAIRLRPIRDKAL